jgi:putative flavoprotein involved in K+ transport
MGSMRDPERIQTVVIGAGQAGLSVGYHLARRGAPFVILDAHQRVGDSWRTRWDSLRLFTAARFDGLVGMPFPSSPYYFPTKNEMGDYLEAYAKRFELPVRSGVNVDRLSREGSRYIVSAGDQRFDAEHVVVAMATYQQPHVPAFARDLDPGIVQFHSVEYRNPAQLKKGGVLIVGAGNSGSEIALELARAGFPTWMSGRDTGHLPFRVAGPARYLLVPFLLRFVFHRVLTMSTPIGRKVRPKIVSKGGPLIRVKPSDLAALGVQRVPRVEGVRDGRPVLASGQVLDAANVIWCTGFHPGHSWIDLPVFGRDGEPRQERGVVTGEPGLYFVGLHFLYAMSSTMIHGVGRDAEFVVNTIVARTAEARTDVPMVNMRQKLETRS